MYFVVSAGGTAGHINPALAVAENLRAAGHEIVYFGTPNHIESQLAVKAGFKFVGLDLAGFDKAHPTTLISSGIKILKATKKVKKYFAQRRPDAVVTFGAYVCIPVGRAAASMGIALIIHEQNSVPGMANSYLAKKADLVCLAFSASALRLQCKNPPVVCGNPVRADFEHCSREKGRTLLGIPANATVLLIFGGSLGAEHLNNAIVAMKKRLLAIEGLYIVHGTGAAKFDEVANALALDNDEAKRWRLIPYIEKMGDVLAASDLVISRAGASSLAEIMTLGVPAVFVPYPYARGDHQTINAKGCIEAGAAELVADDDLDSSKFADLVVSLIQDPLRREKMHKACAAFSGAKAREKFVELLMQTVSAKASRDV